MTRVVLIPGFTQTAASWDAVCTALHPAFDVVAADVPVGRSFLDTALALGQHGPAHYVGYSMGGRLALALAVHQPEVVESLVLVSTTAGIADADERAARRVADHELAAEAERIGTEAFLDRWLAQPMFAAVPADAPGMAERHAWRAADLATMLRTLGTGEMEPLWARLAELTMPAMIVTGTRDAKFDAIGAELTHHIPRARHVRIQGGHALPLECPDALADAIRAAVFTAADA